MNTLALGHMAEQMFIGAIGIGTVLLFAALGELIAERSGVINLGTEGGMLAGAMTGIVVTISTGSISLGIVAGILAGLLTSIMHAIAVVLFNTNQLATGLVVWFIALGVTSVIGANYHGRIVDPLHPLGVPLLSDIPVIGPALFHQNLLVYLGYVLVPVVWAIISRTRAGLTLRATGQRPEVVVATGHKPTVIRIVAVSVGGALAGLGGVALSLGSVGNWSDGMTSGYGFVAVAIVSFARWNPFGALVGSYLFGFALAAGTVVQAHGIAVNQYILDAMPYALTVVVLVVASTRAGAGGPESLRHAVGTIS